MPFLLLHPPTDDKMEIEGKAAPSIGQEDGHQRKLGQLEARLRQAIRSRDAYLERMKGGAGGGQSAPPPHRQRQQLLEMPPENVMAQQQRRRTTRSVGPKRGGAQKSVDYGQRRFASAERRPNLVGRQFGGRAEKEDDGREEEEEELVRRLPSLLSRLETSAHFWEAERMAGGGGNGLDGRRGMATVELLRPLDARIPANYGLLLDSDLPSMDEQLAAIRQNLAQLRQFRLSQPTAEYFQQYSFSTGQPSSRRMERMMPMRKDGAPPSLAQCRARLLNMEFHIEERLRQFSEQRGRREGIAQQPAAIWTEPRGAMMAAAPMVDEGRRAARSIPIPAPSFLHPEEDNPPGLAVLKQAKFGRIVAAPGEEEANHLPPADDGHRQLVERPKQTPPGIPSFEPSRPLAIPPAQVHFIAAADEEGSHQMGGQGGGTDFPRQEFGVEEGMASKKDVDNKGAETMNFQRMLQVLKNPRQFDLSSSSSSDDDGEKQKEGRMVKDELVKNVGLTGIQPISAPSAATANLAPPPIMAAQQQMFVPQKGKTTSLGPGKGDDSDSDFFN